ncbi:hypothetical protein B0H13DRAFT_2413373 [Mycena leptocephala]|nr:hypothetical protein B0H13DRAFT_2413373 [Mycena leptocephala]
MARFHIPILIPADEYGGKPLSELDDAVGDEGNKTLTYGLIIALAGDFYGNYTSSSGDVEQISDNWDTYPDASIALGIEVAKTLSGDTEGYLSGILNTMTNEENEVLDGIQKGQDVAQIFAGFGDKYDWEYNADTKGSIASYVKYIPGVYFLLAICNWDHFGKDAAKAYSAVHTAALRKAKEAYEASQSAADEATTEAVNKIMTEAYFLEAYAQHFLTDLFSSGHLRTPRRKLHRNMLLHGYPVRNKRGDGWAAYGDKQLWSDKSNQNFRMAVEAAQAGLDEVRNTRGKGTIPDAKEFSALELTPILDDELNWRNFCPLFQLENDSILYRSHLDKRSDFSQTLGSFPVRLNWMEMRDRIEASGGQKNLHPWTQGFFSQSSFVHLRAASKTPISLLESRYGPLKTEGFDSTWTMVKQFNPELPFKEEEWISAVSLSPDVRALVGRIHDPEGWRHRYVGITEDTVIWDVSTQVESHEYLLHDVHYGNYSSDAASQIGMLRYFEKSDRSGGRVDTWVVDGSFTHAPRQTSASWHTGLLSFVFSHQLYSTDAYKTFVGLGEENWYFATWSSEYSTLTPTTVEMAPKPEGVIIALLGVDTDPLRGYTRARPLMIVTLYGDLLHLNFFSFTRDELGKVASTRSLSLLERPITWGLSSVHDYLAWFFAKSNLITLGIRDDSSIVVVVFPWPDASPVVSEITLNPDKGYLLNAPFMEPLRTMLTSYTYPGGETTDAAIIMFFDNYGILGARVMAPVTKGSTSYELKGQIPAISGQVSKPLGTRKVGARFEDIGIPPKDVQIL